MRRFGTAVATLGVLALAGSVASIAAKDFPAIGGQGDFAFKDKCPAGQFLVGLKSRSGQWIDQISITCAPVNADGSLGKLFHGPQRGGNGGNAINGTCNPGHIVTGMAMHFTGGKKQVRQFIFNCKSTTSAQRHNLDIGNNVPVFPNDNQVCPNGEAAVGIQGRAGIHVNAVGLLCAKFQLPKPSTPGPSPVSLNPEQAEWLRQHNAARVNHCVPTLVWSAKLAADAQAYASRCVPEGTGFKHDDARGNEGENLAWGTNLGPAAAFKLWYDEINNYNFINPVYTKSPQVGHFTQVVWKTTREVGCAAAQCGNQRLWVCRYAPPGNINVVVRAGVTPQIARQSLLDNVLKRCK